MPLEQVPGVLKSHQCNKKPGEITVSVFLWTLRLTASLLKSFRHRLHCYTLPIHIRPSLYFHKMHLFTHSHAHIPTNVCRYSHILSISIFIHIDSDRFLSWVSGKKITAASSQYSLSPSECDSLHQEITRVILCRLILNDIIIHVKFLNNIIMFSKIVWHFYVTNIENCVV